MSGHVPGDAKVMHLVFLERFPSPQDAESDFEGDEMVYWLPHRLPNR